MAGVVATVLAGCTGVVTTAAGHGTYYPALVLFPYAALMLLFESDTTWLLLTVCLAQYPFYGLALDLGHAFRKLRFAVPILIGIHAAAVIACLVKGLPADFS